MDGVRTCDSPPPIRIPLKWAGVVTVACKPRARSGCALGERGKGLACKPYLESGTPVPTVSPSPYCFDQGEIGRVLTTVSFLSMLEMIFASQSEDYRK